MPTLVEVRDQYRARSIRCQNRALRVSPTPEPRRLSDLMKGRDYYIWAAEQINALIPHEDLPSLRASDDGCPKREVLDAPRSSDGLNVVTTQEEKA